jgi:hypothetical protein
MKEKTETSAGNVTFSSSSDSKEESISQPDRDRRHKTQGKT